MEYKTFTVKVPVPRWRWFRFSLKTLLLLFLAAALALGWWSDRRKLTQEIYDLKHPRRGWDTDQLLGPPNTERYGDIRTAWASKTQDDQDEWLVLEYARAVTPKSVEIYETYNPGAVTKVTVFDERGVEKVAWTGVDPTPQGSPGGVSTIPLKTQAKTRRIKVYLASAAVPGWNEIDAVGLRHGKRGVQWAERAYSSSAYGRNNPLPWDVYGGIHFYR